MEFITIGILLAWFVLWIVRNFPRDNKITYIKQSIKGIDRRLIDLEFKRFKLEELREGVRREFDRMFEVVETLKAKVFSLKESKGDENAIKELEGQLEKYTKDLEGLKQQIGQLDGEISSTNPELPQSVNSQIEVAQEFKKMLVQYLKQIK